MSETQIIKDLARVVAEVALDPSAVEEAARSLGPDERAALNAALGTSYGIDGAWDGDHPTSVYFRDLSLYEDGAPPCGQPSGEHDDGDPLVCLRPEGHDPEFHHCGEFSFADTERKER